MYTDAADLLKKQLGVAGVAIQRTTAFATTQFDVNYDAGSAAFTVYEQSLYKYYKYTDFCERPLTKAMMTTSINAIRAAIKANTAQPAAGVYGDITYDVAAGGYSEHELLARKGVADSESSLQEVIPDTKTGNGGDAKDTGLKLYFAAENALMKAVFEDESVCTATDGVDTSLKLTQCLQNMHYVADALRRHIGY